MAELIKVEIIGLPFTSCSPFPCDETRTCGLSECQPSNRITISFDELKKALANEFGNRVELTLTLIDKGVPDRIKTIIEAEHPPLPIILVNGRLTRIGRIDVERIKSEIRKEL
jgi:hypothetical protein